MGKGCRMTRLEWRVPFSQDPPRVAHLVDMGRWMTKSVCHRCGGNRSIDINTRLSLPAGSIKRCAACARLK